MRLPSLARNLQLLLFLAGEVGWLAAWSVALGVWLGPSTGSSVVGVPSIAGLVVVAFLVTRGVVRPDVPSRRRNAVLVTVGVTLALVVGAIQSLPAIDLLAVPETWAGWLRGGPSFRAV